MSSIVGRPAYVLPLSSPLHAAPAASTTYYFNHFPSTPGIAAATARVYVPMPSIIQYVNLEILCVTPASAETGSLYVRINDTTDYLVSSTVQWNASIQFAFNNPHEAPVMTEEVSPADWYTMKLVTPAWATPPLNVLMFGTIAFAPGI